MNNVNSAGSWNWSRVIHVPHESIDVERFLLRPGDVLFNNTNSQELVGKTALFGGYPERITFSNHFTRLRPGPRLDPGFLAFWLHRLWQSGYFFRASTRWVGQAAFGTAQLLSLSVPLPELAEQRTVAERLNEQLARVASARDLTIDRSNLSRRLGRLALAHAFDKGSREWPRRRVGEVTDTRRSPSVALDGDTAVTTVTSGCLTPFGFSFDGLGVGRMSSRDAIEGVVSVGEVLVARSNTEALVGRASLYPGHQGDVVASDLVFRLLPDQGSLTADYLASYLSVLQLEGYWRDRSSGASSTMKKITKTQLLDVEIPLPPIHEQLLILTELRERLDMTNDVESSIQAEREAIEALPAALLRRAFQNLAA